MSENPSDIADDTVITKSQLEKMLDDRDLALIMTLEKRQKAQFDSLMNGIEQRLDPIIQQLNNNTQYINQLATNAQPQQQQGGAAQRKTTLKELVENDIIPLVDAARERGYLRMGEETELDGPTKLLKTAIDREARKIVLKSVRQAMNKGLLFHDEVEQLVGDAIDHQPV